LDVDPADGRAPVCAMACTETTKKSTRITLNSFIECTPRQKQIAYSLNRVSRQFSTLFASGEH
jgi:hypothetical protein